MNTSGDKCTFHNPAYDAHSLIKKIYKLGKVRFFPVFLISKIKDR